MPRTVVIIFFFPKLRCAGRSFCSIFPELRCVGGESFSSSQDYAAQIHILSTTKTRAQLEEGFSFGTDEQGSAASSSSNPSGTGAAASSPLPPDHDSTHPQPENETSNTNDAGESSPESVPATLRDEERSKVILRCKNPSLATVAAMLSVINGVTAKSAQSICEELLVLPQAGACWQKVCRDREARTSARPGGSSSPEPDREARTRSSSRRTSCRKSSSSSTSRSTTTTNWSIPHDYLELFMEHTEFSILSRNCPVSGTPRDTGG